MAIALVLSLPTVALADGDFVGTALDAVTTPKHPVALRAKFTRSGLLRRELGGTVVTFGAGGESRWTRTDPQGFAETTVQPGAVSVGEFQARLARDAGTVARARLFVLDPARPVAVIDVDGTLSDMMEWRVPFSGDVADTFPGAPDLVNDLARTHAIVYLTARDDRFDRITRAFLARHGFPDGPIIYDDLGLGTKEQRAQLLSKNHGKFKLAQIRALQARGVRVTIGIGNAETDGFAYESAGLKSYLRTKKSEPGRSFRFIEYAALRERLELDGILPETPTGVSRSGIAGRWKYSFSRDRAPYTGVLDVRHAEEGGLLVTAFEDGGGRWDGRATLQGSLFVVQRVLSAGVTGALAGAGSDLIEYVATLHGADSASVEVFRITADHRTRIGSGELTRPPYLSGLRREVDRAIAKGDDAIIGLGDDALAVATPDEKVAMIEVLMNFGKEHFPTVRGLNPIPVRESRQEAILRILRSAKDAAEFDRVYFRLNATRLRSALTGREDAELRALVAKHHGSARPGDWDGYLRYLDTVTGSSTSGKNRIDFLVDGPTVIPAVLRELDAAKTSIHLSVFEWQADETGTKLADVLSAKARAGVKVRVLLDGNGTGSSDEAREIIEGMRRAGVDVIVNKPGLTKSHLDHRKVLVVDGRVGFTGGMNVGDHYQKEWHDQQTLLEGPVVAKLQDAFLSRWIEEGGTPPLPSERLYPPLDEVAGGFETRIVGHQGAGVDRNIKAAYLRAIGTATRTIRISTPYFSDQDVVDALVAAARRGVKVQVVLPRQNDMAIMKKVAEAYYPQLLAAGVEVYEYLPRMAHQKVAVIDSLWCTAGSSNLDARSLEFNDELNYVVLDPKLAATIERSLFDVDLKQSERVAAPSSGFLDGVLRLTSGWL